MVAIISGNSLGLSAGSSSTLGERGVFGNSAQGRSGEQAFVNLANGNLVLQRRDDFLASRGQGLEVLRTYNSNGLLNDDNADNWSIGIYNRPLQLSGTLNAAGSVFTRTASDGAQSAYTFEAARGLYVGTDGAGAYDTLQWDADHGQYVWIDGSTGTQERYQGDAGARLLSRTDASGNTTTYRYGSDGLLASVTDASGETTQYDYSGHNLSQVRVTAQDGTTNTTRVRYSYDSQNRLSVVTVDLSPGDNDIADGKVYQTTYTYDGDSRRVTSLAQSDGTRLEVSYALVDGDYRVASVRDALGLTTRYTYETATRTTTVTDPMNVSSRYGYDDKGQLLRVQTGITEGHPEGVSQLYYHYDEKGNVTAMVDALGRSITLQYDVNGNQTLKVDPLGNAVVRTYDDYNQLLTETLRAGDGGGNAAAPALGGTRALDSTTRYIYSGQTRDRVRFVVSAEGRVNEYCYDAQGQRVSTLVYAAAAFDVGSLGATEVPTEAQMVNWAAAQNMRGGQRIDSQYNFRGQLSLSIAYGTLTAAGEGSDPAVTQYVYSQAGELLKTVQPLTESVTQYIYDGLGRVILTSAPSSDGTSANTTITEYGATSTTVTLNNGLSTVSNYDAAGRLTSVLQSSAGSTLGTTRYTYDAAGRLVSTQDPTGVRQWVVYDDAGRKVADVDGIGAVKEYRYNVNSQLTQTIAYAGRLVGLVSPPTLETIQAISSADDRKSWRIYDSAQRLAWQVDASGAVTQTQYDAGSRVVAMTRIATPIDPQTLGDGADVLVVGNSLIRMGRGASTSLLVQAKPAVSSGDSYRIDVVAVGIKDDELIEFRNGNTLLGTGRVINGVATFITDALPSGKNRISAFYAGSSGIAAAMSEPMEVMVLRPSATTLTFTPSGVALGGELTLDLSVTAKDPKGTVVFFVGERAVGTAELVGGVARLKVIAAKPFFTVGINEIKASYSGDEFNASVISSAAHVVLQADSEVPDLRQEPELKISGISPKFLVDNSLSTGGVDFITFQATVGGSNATGTVTFLVGGRMVGYATVINGRAILMAKIPGLSSGKYDVVASYSGNDDYKNSIRLEESALQVLVLPAPAASIDSINFISNGGLSVSAKVGGKFPLSGEVEFYSGANFLGASTVSQNGLVFFNLAGKLLGGNNSITLKYRGGPGADVVAKTRDVKLWATVDDFSVYTPNEKLKPGGPLTLRADLKGEAISGVVTFYANGEPIATASVANGAAQATTLLLRDPGHFNITASYSGNANYISSLSNKGASIEIISGAAVTSLHLLGSTKTNLNISGLTPFGALLDADLDLKAFVTKSDGSPASSGTVSFYENDVLLGSAHVVDGGAKFTLAAGVRNNAYGSNSLVIHKGHEGLSGFKAVYSGDDENASSNASSAVSFVKNFNPNPSLSLFRQEGKVGGAAYEINFASPTIYTGGPISFYAGDVLIGMADIVNGQARISGVNLPEGAVEIVAKYPGNDFYREGAYGKTVNVQGDSFIELTAPSDASNGNGEVFKIAASVRAGHISAGTVTFYVDGKIFSSIPVINGAAVFSPKSLSAGLHRVVAYYSGGDLSYYSLSKEIEIFIPEPKVNSRPIPEVFVSSPFSVGSKNIMVGVKGEGAAGSMAVLNGSSILGVFPLINGLAEVPLEVIIGVQKDIVLMYSGSEKYQANTLLLDLPVLQAQAQIKTTTLLGVVVDDMYLTLTAKVIGAKSGRVNFYKDDYLLGVADLNNALASIKVPNSSWGKGGIVARYEGEGNIKPSTSTPLMAASVGVSVGSLVTRDADKTISNLYSGDGLLIGTIDSEGYLTEYRYDAAGRTIGIVRYSQPVAGGASLAAARAGGSLSGLRPAVSASDAHTAYFYDAQGRQIGELDAEGFLTQTKYDGNGNLVATYRYANPVIALRASQVTAATRLADILPANSVQDQITTRAYDALNRIVVSTNAEGSITRYRYDSAGHLTQTTQAAGAVEATTLNSRYDAQGRLITELSAEGAALLASGQSQVQIDAIWSQYGQRHDYDAAGRRVRTTDQRGQTTLFFYDADSRLTHTINALGEVMETQYNAFGEVSTGIRYGTRIDVARLTGANAGGLVNGTLLSALDQAKNVALDSQTTYRYNTTGTLAGTVDALGFAKNYVYNSFGEEVSRTAVLSSGLVQTVTTAYDRRGLIIQRTEDPGGLSRVSSTAYDAFRRPIRTVDGLGQIRTQTYDLLGRTIATTNALGGSVTTTYDAFGRTVSQTDALGHVTSYAYSAAERSLTVTTPEGIQVKTVYDRLGQVQTVLDGEGNTAHYTYDKNGLRTGVATSLGFPRFPGRFA
ncbi:hypothetical protein AVMA1855_24145 [Acidovorax sp. SUPP1855]|uniref:Ig-like domain repeat protein n=1 Tax=Acidovorax sp. SUPP1855 TaxID=431774 RepID=UPI0023DE4141|nr:Ig-like domain repeat protein [Acidovorax sp. SUPP1855]GKS87303.1 hypothetical protein AVMA1855_24145 [Acidovorax sp. SUPP1855]